MKKKEVNRFNIDFFEFAFLVEACVPPRPIARAMFWGEVIDKHYHVLTENEREKLFEWINRTYAMEQGIENKNEDCLLFNSRFDKKNQYEVTTKFNGITEKYDCFKLGDKYHNSVSRSIIEDYIIEVKPLNNLDYEV